MVARIMAAAAVFVCAVVSVALVFSGRQPRGVRLVPYLLDASDAGRPAGSFHICGNYCGAGWCNGGWTPEGMCDETVDPERAAGWMAYGGDQYSCADACCREHDRCCNGEDERGCNSAIVDCLLQCEPEDTSCTTEKGKPVSPVFIADAMGLVEDWCCGQPCNNAEDEESEEEDLGWDDE